MPMLRILTLTLALAAMPAWAAGPSVSVAGARVVEGPRLGLGPAQPCAARGDVTIHVTFTDPDGVTYADVRLGSVRVRPEVTPQVRAAIWVPDYSRPDRFYRWRYENRDRPSVSHTIPITVELVPGVGSVPAEIVAKDARGALTIRHFRLIPAACR
jgi:hypothetical protein